MDYCIESEKFNDVETMIRHYRNCDICFESFLKLIKKLAENKDLIGEELNGINKKIGMI